MVAPADNTLGYIRKKVRRLTASASESSLSTEELDRYINSFYSNDFPYAIKLDQMRQVYTFFTQPYIDKYPLDVNYNMGVREPVYFEGIRGSFYKDRDSFYALWPRWPTKYAYPSVASGTITGATNASPCVITSANHGLVTNDSIYIEDVGGMIQLNGNTFTVTYISANTFSIGVDSSLYGVYTSGGTWIKLNYSGTISTTPFLRNEVTIGVNGNNGTAISIADDGNGNLQLQTPNLIVYQAPQSQTNPAPGMKNINTGSPGMDVVQTIGTVNYITGAFEFTLISPPLIGDIFTIWVSQYQTGRPYSLLFWNNYFIVRPVPKLIHKVEVETYYTPCQFLANTDNPILNQWSKYIAIGTARDILNDRQDMDGVTNLDKMFKEQEALVLERQGVEEIGQRNRTIFTQTQQIVGWSNGNQGYYP